jgi:hypothetical protein
MAKAKAAGFRYVAPLLELLELASVELRHNAHKADGGRVVRRVSDERSETNLFLGVTSPL